MNETTITLVGNTVSDVQLRATRDGAAWATFRMASSPRRYDRETARWVDGEPLFVTVVCWRALGGKPVAADRTPARKGALAVEQRPMWRNY